ncbi:MAG: MmcQ/YjbR family DNA-binding protein [Treponemataceae bacterium]
MNYKELRYFCLSLPNTTSDFPFDEVTEVFRIHGKIFALCTENQPLSLKINLKCDPDLAADLRKTYTDVVPGWHMNHQHWNTVTVNGTIPDEKLRWMIQHSYECVQAGMPKKLRGK